VPNDITLFLAGDVMLGRGVDQVLPHPGDPLLRERHMHDARGYVDLAEDENGPIPRPVPFDWPWGVLLDALDDVRPDGRIVNLETSVTTSDDYAPGKAVHYRMHPDNLAALTLARPDVTVLANNHVLDFGTRGLEETLDSLARAGLNVAGAGRNLEEARRPAVIGLADTRLLVFGVGLTSSGIPDEWAADEGRPGVRALSEFGRSTATTILQDVERWRRPGDLVVVSIHWGSNWGYRVPHDQLRLGHALIEGGVDLVHGHSSHHPRPIEVHQGKLILHGCGDLIDDYEGIHGYEKYRDDLRVAYLASLDRRSGRLTRLRMLVLKARRMRLEHASAEDVDWLRDVLDRVSGPLGASLMTADGVIELT
jgi:poly-gamma-glutamate synthesis protein (capsule biosynthesis protein)